MKRELGVANKQLEALGNRPQNERRPPKSGGLEVGPKTHRGAEDFGSPLSYRSATSRETGSPPSLIPKLHSHRNATFRPRPAAKVRFVGIQTSFLCKKITVTKQHPPNLLF